MKGVAVFVGRPIRPFLELFCDPQEIETSYSDFSGLPLYGRDDIFVKLVKKNNNMFTRSLESQKINMAFLSSERRLLFFVVDD